MNVCKRRADTSIANFKRLEQTGIKIYRALHQNRLSPLIWPVSKYKKINIVFFAHICFGMYSAKTLVFFLIF